MAPPRYLTSENPTAAGRCGRGCRFQLSATQPTQSSTCTTAIPALPTSNRQAAFGIANYKGVWHLKETCTGASGEVKDSTANANNCTGDPTRLPVVNTSGRIQNAETFNGSANGSTAGKDISGPATGISGTTVIIYAPGTSQFGFISRLLRRVSSALLESPPAAIGNTVLV